MLFTIFDTVNTQMDDWGSIPDRGWDFFSLPIMSRAALGSTKPPIQWIPGALSLEVKWLGHEVDHSPPSSAEVKKNAWSYTSTPLIHLHCMVIS
jgi:hypothetical protein